VILTTLEEVETWMTAPPDEALKLQRPLPDGTLQIVTRGVKEDPAEIPGKPLKGKSQNSNRADTGILDRCPRPVGNRRPLARLVFPQKATRRRIGLEGHGS